MGLSCQRQCKSVPEVLQMLRAIGAVPLVKVDRLVNWRLSEVWGFGLSPETDGPRSSGRTATVRYFGSLFSIHFPVCFLCLFPHFPVTSTLHNVSIDPATAPEAAPTRNLSVPLRSPLIHMRLPSDVITARSTSGVHDAAF